MGKDERKKGFFLNFFGQKFLTCISPKKFFMVFLNSPCRETHKSAGKDERKKVLFSQLFRPKVFDMYFPQKVFYGVFELSLLRNAQKRHKKISKKKEKRYLPTPFIICQVYAAFNFIFLRRPSAQAQAQAQASSVKRQAGLRGAIIKAKS
jgi:hypothetical protein